MRFVLASGSPRRRELLTQVGIEFEVMASGVEETVAGSIPKEVVCELSKQKACDVFSRTVGDVAVIGADTVVSVNDRILGKPHDEESAAGMLFEISGRSHSVFTGVTLCLRRNGVEEVITFAEETKVFVEELTQKDIDDYIATKEPMDKAGAYGIQGRFAAYVGRIEGDYNNVVGLPVGRVCRTLREKGIL